ncbi:MAG TPA: hypothetical protein VFW28_16085 [Micropepsaceae bacterium]|nr:hypothetical protein [Micropepsaceae bacterium]
MERPDGLATIAQCHSAAGHGIQIAREPNAQSARGITLRADAGSNSDATAVHRVDASTREWTVFHNGQPTLTGRFFFSPDGKTMNWNVSGKNAQGHAINRTQIFEKQ